jgi:hypothetical protein
LCVSSVSPFFAKHEFLLCNLRLILDTLLALNILPIALDGALVLINLLLVGLILLLFLPLHVVADQSATG